MVFKWYKKITADYWDKNFKNTTFNTQKTRMDMYAHHHVFIN